MNEKQLIIDEARGYVRDRLSQSGQDHAMVHLPELARGCHIHIVAFTQSPSDVALAFRDNCAVQGIIGHLANNTAYRSFGEIMGFDRELQEYARANKRHGTIWLSHPSEGTLQIDVPDLPAIRQNTVSQAQVDESALRLLDRVRSRIIPIEEHVQVSDDAKPKEAVTIEEKALSALHALAKREVECVENGNYRGLAGLTPIWEVLNEKSGRVKQLIGKWLKEHNLVLPHIIRVYRSNTTFVEITDTGWETAGIEKPVLKGKGSWFHCVLAGQLAKHFDDQGYSCLIEGRLHLDSAKSEYKQLDVLLRSPNGALTGCEIGLSSPDQEVSNAILDFEAGIDSLIVVAPTKKMLDRIQKAMLAEPKLECHISQIIFQTAGGFFK